MSVQEFNKGHSFRMTGITYRGLCRYLAELPDIAFTRRPRFFWSGEDGLLEYLQRNYKHEIEAGRLVVYNYWNVEGGFRMAHAKNMAHRCGLLEGGDVLVNLDADNYTGRGFGEWIEAEWREWGPEVFGWARMVQRCNEKVGEGRCLLARQHAGRHDPSMGALDGVLVEARPRVRGISGRIVVGARAFVKTGGYDERFETWGADDQDFNERLKLLGYEAREIPVEYLGAIHHSQKMRFREYPAARRDEDCAVVPDDRRRDTAVVNFGRVGEGVVFRNFGMEPITLGAIPTRIFGIGMQKTATTSLDKALRILGYDSVHWESPAWARRVWTEVRQEGKSLTLERHYAACDFPITILYRELDRAYPGSKYILTVRSEREWVESVRRHWSVAHNPYRGTWDGDAFSHRMHREVYGRKQFDEEIFLNRYRRHNDEVVEYFRGRPADLLVMNMNLSGGDGWRKLCGFLGRPVPGGRYPREFKTGGGRG